jgi:hypothetical protein
MGMNQFRKGFDWDKPSDFKGKDNDLIIKSAIHDRSDYLRVILKAYIRKTQVSLLS